MLLFKTTVVTYIWQSYLTIVEISIYTRHTLIDSTWIIQVSGKVEIEDGVDKFYIDNYVYVHICGCSLNIFTIMSTLSEQC